VQPTTSIPTSTRQFTQFRIECFSASAQDVPVAKSRFKMWRVCGKPGTLIVQNISEQTLLVSPQNTEKLQVLRSADAETIEGMAEEALSGLLALDTLDAQVGSSAHLGAVYVAPGAIVRATGPIDDATRVDISASLYGTLRYAGAKAFGTYATDKLGALIASRQLVIRQAMRSCVDGLRVTDADLANQPDMISFAQEEISESASCYSAARSLDPDRTTPTFKREIRGFAKTAVKELPAGFWTDLIHWLGVAVPRR